MGVGSLSYTSHFLTHYLSFCYRLPHHTSHSRIDRSQRLLSASSWFSELEGRKADSTSLARRTPCCFRIVSLHLRVITSHQPMIANLQQPTLCLSVFTGFHFSFPDFTGFSFFSIAFVISPSPLSTVFHFFPTFSVYQSSTLLFFLSFTSLVSYFSLAPCARLNYQFSVSFRAHVKSSSNIRVLFSHAMSPTYCSPVNK